MIRSFVRRWLYAPRSAEYVTHLSTQAKFPLSDTLKARYARKGILVEENPDTWVRPLDYDEAPPPV